jgi:TolB-like protein
VKALSTACVLLTLFAFIGCASQPAAVKKQPSVSSQATETAFQTPRFTELNETVIFLATSLVDDFANTRVTSEDKQTVVAVADFATDQGKITRLGRVVADKMISTLVNSGRFSVLERDLIDRVIAEQKFQLSPFADEGSAAEFGKILGAEAIVTGKLSDLGSVFYLSTRVIDVATGSLLTSADAELDKRRDWVSLYRAEIPHLNKPKVQTRLFRAEGIGFPSAKFQNSAQADYMAFRAAKGDAIRNLVEEIKGTQVAADTTIEQMMTQNDSIRMQLNTSLQGARVVSRENLPDGSVRVEMEVELSEAFLRTISGP